MIDVLIFGGGRRNMERGLESGLLFSSSGLGKVILKNLGEAKCSRR